MEKKLSKDLNDLIVSVTESDDFKECIRLKKKMEDSSEIKELVENIKILQKKYVRTDDSDIKEELDKVQNRLDSIPLYASYQAKLMEVNRKIDIIKDELNEYFNNVVNN